MKIQLIGSHMCQDTLYAMMKLKEKGAEITFCDISASFPALKTFITIRETDPIYDPVKAQGGLGIPLFIFEDGRKTLSMEMALKQIEEG